MVEGIPLVSSDVGLEAYAIQRIWQATDGRDRRAIAYR